MNILKKTIGILTLLMMAMTSMAQKTSINFEVSFKEPQAHYGEIKMEIQGIKKDYVDVKMPVWTPGSYLVREYSRHVESFGAKNAQGQTLDHEKISKNTWRIYSKNVDKIIVDYRIYGFEISVRTNFIDDVHAFLSPAATFMYVDGYLDHPVQVTIKPHANWKHVSTGLNTVEGKTFTYSAPDFDILFDTPIEVGNQEIFTFTANNVLHEVAMVNAGSYDKDRLIEDFTKIIEESTKIFGVNPNKRYVFIVHHFQSGGGGLEHLNSTVLGASRSTYNNPRLYINYLGLVAHEYFHLWFVKRLRPIELGPFNYDAENYSTGLWIMEGFTSYYDNLILRRTGFYNETGYLGALSSDFNAVENKPGNDVQPVALASIDAWIKYYRPDENSDNTSVSYYNKGALLAMLMDVKIIAESKGKKKLDDAVKAAYHEFYEKLDRGFTEEEFEALIEKTTGVSVSEIFRMAHTTEEIDYNLYLNKVGYTLINRNEGNQDPDLGVNANTSNGRLMINSVRRGSAAWDAGLNVRDEIIAVNNNRVDSPARLNSIIQEYKSGDVVEVMVTRDGLIRSIEVKLTPSTMGAYSVVPLTNATEEQKNLGKIWLSID